MVADDEEELVVLFKTFLEKSGYEAIHFTDPIMDLEHFENNYDKVHLIITNLKMPKLDGIELANEVREFSKTVKILLITAFVVDDVLQTNDFKKAEIAEILQKPLHFKDLGSKNIAS
jgi:DNA-binding response OmpR family regulator